MTHVHSSFPGSATPKETRCDGFESLLIGVVRRIEVDDLLCERVLSVYLFLSNFVVVVVVVVVVIVILKLVFFDRATEGASDFELRNNAKPMQCTRGNEKAKVNKKTDCAEMHNQSVQLRPGQRRQQQRPTRSISFQSSAWDLSTTQLYIPLVA